jgi:PEP-CTERM motif
LTSARHEFYNSHGADFTQGVLNVMQTKLIVTTAVLLGLAAPAHAELFTIGANFTVELTNSPTSENDTVTFSPGVTQLIDGGNLDLTISLVDAGGGAEWVVLNYQTVSADLPLSLAGENWGITPLGLPAAVALNFIGDYTQWQGADGANIAQTGRIFGQTLMASPIAGVTGSGEGTLGFIDPIGGPGPLTGLGAFANPFGQVLNGLPADQVNGFTAALEFAPATAAVPEPSTWAMMFLGFAGLGFLGYRQTTKARVAA